VSPMKYPYFHRFFTDSVKRELDCVKALSIVLELSLGSVKGM
jgi:hypothetical protein